MTENVLPGWDRAQDIVRDFIWEPLTEAAIAAVFVKVPFLNVWPLRPIVKGALRWFSSSMWSKADELTDLAALHFVNAKHKAEFDRASVKLRAVAIEKGVNSDEFRKERDEATRAFSTFIRFNG